jgi:hypothetical protein
MAVSSASSMSGMSCNSLRSLTSRACSLSRWLDTEMYSPNAIDTAPATKPASPAVKIGPRCAVAPATPSTMPATETMPSLAPSTAARNQFNRADARDLLTRVVHTDAEGTADAARLGLAQLVVFDGPKDPQHLVPSPSGVPTRDDVVVIGLRSAVVDHAVQRTRSAEDLAPDPVLPLTL